MSIIGLNKQIIVSFFSSKIKRILSYGSFWSAPFYGAITIIHALIFPFLIILNSKAIHSVYRIGLIIFHTHICVFVCSFIFGILYIVSRFFWQIFKSSIELIIEFIRLFLLFHAINRSLACIQYYLDSMYVYIVLPKKTIKQQERKKKGKIFKWKLLFYSVKY